MKKNKQVSPLNQKYKYIFLVIGILLPLLTVASAFFALGLYVSVYEQQLAPVPRALYTIFAFGIVVGGIVAIYFCIKTWQIFKDFALYKQRPVSVKATLIYALVTLAFCGLALAGGIIGFNGTPNRADYLTTFFIVGFVIISIIILFSAAALIYFGLQKLIMDTK